jgi:hypothetical protein
MANNSFILGILKELTTPHRAGLSFWGGARAPFAPTSSATATTISFNARGILLREPEGQPRLSGWLSGLKWFCCPNGRAETPPPLGSLIDCYLV